MQKVSVIKTQENLLTTVAEAVTKADADDVISPGDSVLLKPNFHGGVGVTSPAVLKAIARWVWDCGAREIVIGDGPFYGISDARGHFENLGVIKLAEEVGAQYAIFDEGAFRIFKNASKYLPDELGITQFVYDCDKVINIPVMKTHFNTLVTLGMKNLKGCIRRREKRIFHEMNLDRAIVELNRILKPDLTILDATRAMEGMGPGSGVWVDMGLMLASKDVVALDVVACYLMGVEADEVMLLRFARQTKLGETDISKIEVVGENLDEHKRRFERPLEAILQNYPDLKIFNKGACSGCNMNFFGALRQLNDNDLKWNEIVIGHDTPKSKDALLIGACTSKYRKEYPHLAGCPPSIEEIMNQCLKPY